MSSDLPGPPLRIAVFGDFEGVHTRRWTAFFAERGHDVHGISYYQPATDVPGVKLHVLSGKMARSSTSRMSGARPGPLSNGPHGAVGSPVGRKVRNRVPAGVMRLVHAFRYQRAGLRRVLRDIRPNVFHAHYAVEHGFYGALAGFYPYVVSAWGSDIFVEAQRPLGRLIASLALHRADLVTANDAAMARQIEALGVPSERIRVIRLGIDPVFFEGERKEPAVPTIISDRAHERLYNIDTVLRAFAALRMRLPAARLWVAHEGSETERLKVLAGELGLGDSVVFLGRLSAAALRDALTSALVYVSVPSSDSFPLSTLEAMAAGAFPVVSDLPSQDGWIEHAGNGLRVPPRDVSSLADALQRALMDTALRSRAIRRNRELASARGDHRRNMTAMESEYYRLAGKLRAREASIQETLQPPTGPTAPARDD